MTRLLLELLLQMVCIVEDVDVVGGHEGNTRLVHLKLLSQTRTATRIEAQ